MAKTVLVTGAYGFIGRHTALHFAEKGCAVIGIGHGVWDRKEWKQWGISEWHTSDISLDALITYAGEPQVIIHCAGSGSVGFSMTHPFQDYQRTVETTLSVLEYTRRYAPKARIVYPSSAGVYGHVDEIPIRETAQLNPVSPYGVHKKMAEELCRSYARHFNISASVIRFFSVYGQGLRKQLLWDTCHKLKNNDIDFFGDGAEQRDWLHVTDAAALIETAAEETTNFCPVVNGGSGEGLTVRTVLEFIFACFGRKDTPRFTGNSRIGDPKHYVADISIAREWGWEPQINWQAGFKEYVAWFKKGAI